MSLSTLTSPPIWSPSYNPILWEVQSDQSGQFKFKYVFDVYLSPSLVPIRFKVPPNPAGKGIIDVSSICESAIKINQNLPMISTTPFTLGSDLSIPVYVLAGEEYATSATGTPVMYNGNGIEGEPAYGLYANDLFQPAPSSTMKVVAYAAAQGAHGYYNYQLSGGEDVLPYIMNSPTSKFLRNEPGTTSQVRSDETVTLSWLNWNFLAATGPQASPYAMKVTKFLAGATGDSLVYYNTVANGGVWPTETSWPDPMDAFAPVSSDYYMESFKLDMSGLTGAFDKICFQLFPYETYGATGLGATGISEQVCYEINDSNCWGFEPIRITWLNAKGGRDWYTFIKRNTFTQNAERQTFYQIPSYWSNSQFSVGDINPARYGTSVFNVNLSQSWTASTDWLTEQESAWLRDLFKSPSVHVYLPGNEGPTLVTVTDGSYSTQNYAREKLFQYFISFVEAQPDKVQGY